MSLAQSSSIPTSNSINTATANVATPVVAAQPPNSRRVQSTVLADLRGVFQQLAEKNSRRSAYVHAAMRAIVTHHGLLGFSMTGRMAAETLGDFACVGSLKADEQLQLRNLVGQAALAGHSELNCRITGPYSLESKRVFLVALPMLSESRDDLVASVCFAFSPDNDRDVQLRAYELQASLMLAVQMIPIAKQFGSKLAIDDKLQMTARVSRYSDTREFAYALVKSIAARFDCEQVALGTIRDAQLKVLAVSGTATFKPSSPGIIDIQQSMEEARDAAQTIVFQPEGQSAKHKKMPIHTRWGTSCQSAVCSIPLQAGRDCIAVLTLRRHLRLGFTEANVEEIEKLVKPFGAAVELSLRGDRTLKSHSREVATKILEAVRNPKTRAGRIARQVSMVVAAIVIFGWFPYRPLTPCVLVPGNATQSLAAFDMQLAEAKVRSGDHVARGQVLAKFDTRQLDLERAGLLSQLEQAEVDVRRALVKKDAASASLAKASSQVFANQLAAVEKKIAQCTITAPEDGMVMDAELNRKVGQVFPQGSPILSFSPLDSWQVEIQIPEHQARYFQQNQTGCFAPTANPNRTLNFTITSISGSAELIDGKNVFVATAEVDGKAEFFRQGMEGIARTHTGWQPIPWILLHRLFEYGRAGFWM
jgi:Barrel-sandwich domain of CusB or HlyD membrane-fusion